MEKDKKEGSPEFVLQFTGTVTHKLDPKSRVAIPAIWRDENLSRLMFFFAEEKQYTIVKCFTLESLRKHLDKKAKAAKEQDFSEDEIEEYIESIIGNCMNADLNTQGKVVIPKQILERLDLTDSISLVGVGAYFKLWNPEQLKAVEKTTSEKRKKLNAIFQIG